MTQERVVGAAQGSALDAEIVLAPLIATLQGNYPKAPSADIKRAYEVAAHAHRDQLRKSGEPYITHPLAVAGILADLGMNTPTLIAALLHDTVEDTEYSLEQIKRDFGAEVAELVDGVTKLDKVTFGKAAEAETVRKMVVAMARDIRVLVIKLADRLHNARTWRYVSAESAEKKAKETLDIYAPLAHRLGMNAIKWELEDLSFATLYPKMYEEISRLVAESAPTREGNLAHLLETVNSDLSAAGVVAEVSGRPKHYYSVYQKMIVRGSLERLTPVLMTALVAAFALVPLLVSADAPGKEVLHPVAVVIFGGLISSTLLDSLLTPLMFWLWGEKPLAKLLESSSTENY